jgi:hypothetical protein
MRLKSYQWMKILLYLIGKLHIVSCRYPSQIHFLMSIYSLGYICSYQILKQKIDLFQNPG